MRKGVISVGALIIFVAIVFAIFTIYGIVMMKANPPIRPASAYFVSCTVLFENNTTSGGTYYHNYTIAINVVNGGGVHLLLRSLIIGMRPPDLEHQAMVRVNGTDINPWPGAQGQVGEASYRIVVNETGTTGFVEAEEGYFLPQGGTGRLVLDIMTWSDAEDPDVFPEGTVIYGYLVFDCFTVQFSFVG